MNAQRDGHEWQIGSFCEIYSASKNKWHVVKVINIFKDHNDNKLVRVQSVSHSEYVKDLDPNRTYIRPYNKTKKKDQNGAKSAKKGPRGRPWKQYEKDGLLRMHKEGKSTKVMAEQLERTENAIRQKLRLLLIDALKCCVCSAQFESEKALKIHQARKQDAAHQKLREQQNKNDDNKKKGTKRRKSNIGTNYDKITESALTEKFRALSMEEKSFKCLACSAKFESEKALKLHELGKQDAAHKRLREINKKMEGHNMEKKKRYKKQRIFNTNTIKNDNKNITNVNITIQGTPKCEKKDSYSSQINNKLNWDSKQCADWIGSLGDDYKQYIGKWKSSNISGELLNKLNDDDLSEIVKNRIHRKGILNAWKKM